jgi:hypothetical protein
VRAGEEAGASVFRRLRCLRGVALHPNEQLTRPPASPAAVQVQHRLTALVREADAGDAEVPEDGAGGGAAVTGEPEAAPVAAPEEERPNKKKRKDREDGERKEKKAKKEKKARKDKG